MILILEGPDGAGKSTLAAHLAARWSDEGKETVYLHNGPPPPGVDPRRLYTEQLAQACRMHALQGQNVIIDRFSVGELVYPRTRGRETNFTAFDNDTLVQISTWHQFDAQWMILAPPIATLVERLAQKAEHVTDEMRRQLQEERDLFVLHGKRMVHLFEDNVQLVHTSEFSVEELSYVVAGFR